MILDNKNTNLKVHEWIAKYTKEGKFSLVTGYFTIGALAYSGALWTLYQAIHGKGTVPAKQSLQKSFCRIMQIVLNLLMRI